MCGRFVLATKVSAFVDMLGFEVDPGSDPQHESYFTPEEIEALEYEAKELEKELSPQYNIAPRFKIPAIARVDNQAPTIGVYKWGLLAPWAKDPAMGDKCFNARSETVAEKPTFRSAFKHSRAVILADGYYEWKKLDTKNKQPYYIHAEDSEPMFFAGLVEPKTQTSTILTMEADGDLGEIHHRHPVFLGADEVGEWLDAQASKDDLLGLVQASGVDGIEAYPVSKAVGKVGDVNDESLIEKMIK